MTLKLCMCWYWQLSYYARFRQPTARTSVSSGPPAHSCHKKKIFQECILFAIPYRVTVFHANARIYFQMQFFFPDVLDTNISPTVTKSPNHITLLATKILPLKVSSSITILAAFCSCRTHKHRSIGCISRTICTSSFLQAVRIYMPLLHAAAGIV